MNRVALILALLAPAVGLANEPKPSPAAEMLLGAIDIFLTPENIKKAGLTEAQAVTVLEDAQRKRYLRVRAVNALNLFATPTARVAIERAALQSDDYEVRRQAVVSLARGFGPGDKAGVTDALKRISQDAPVQLRSVIADEVARLHKSAP